MRKTFLMMAAMMVSVLMQAADCQDGPYGLQINGSKVVDAPKYGDPDYQGRVQYKASCVELAAGDVVKLINKSCDATWMVDLDPYGEYQSFEGGATANQLTCKKAGKYDFYIKLSMEVGDILYVGPAENCGTPGYDGAAPAQCPDVMLQAFYWDSYDGTKATTKYGRTRWIDHVNGTNGSSAAEMGQWFDMVWLPPMSAGSGTGYHPTNYGKLDSDRGTKSKLVELIEILHKNGARVIADIVINHADAQEGWCNFKSYDFGSYGKFTPDGSYICSTDEMNTSAPTTACRGYATGAADDGYGDEANYAASRDWDHTNAEVREMFKAYLKWMRNEVKVDGFRYDYCKGYHNSHINEYNRAAEAYFSVMEYWDGNVNTLQSRLSDAGWNTTTFDFATKYTAFNDGIAADNYWKLQGAGLPGAGKARYAVTFIDSHDGFQRNDNEFCGNGNSMTICKDKVLICNAYMLSMPGVPCVFWPHWVTFKDEIKKMINARYKAGVHSESSVTDESVGDGYYKATINGTNGSIRLLLGPNSGYNSTPSGYTLAVKGTNYGVYYKMNSARGDKDKERQPIVEGVKQPSDSSLKGRGEKFIENGKLYIRCGEHVYDIMGKPIK